MPEFIKSKQHVSVHNKSKCIYIRPPSKVHYVRHNKQYITLKEYKSIIKQKQIRGGMTILPASLRSLSPCKESKAEIEYLKEMAKLHNKNIETLTEANNNYKTSKEKIFQDLLQFEINMETTKNNTINTTSIEYHGKNILLSDIFFYIKLNLRNIMDSFKSDPDPLIYKDYGGHQLTYIPNTNIIDIDKTLKNY